MSQYPWPEDIYAVARLDWCRSIDTPEGGPVAQLLCNNLARQCGSFTNSTKDRARIARTAPQLQELLEPAEIEAWSGRCPRARAQGVCNLGGAKAYQEELWGAFAQPRQDRAYERINEDPRKKSEAATPEEAAEEPAGLLAEAVFPARLDRERVEAFDAMLLDARPRRVVSDYAIRSLPFL